jgi:hypothetical protein
LGAGDLQTQDRDLMAHDEDLRVLGAIISRQEHQPAEHPNH